MFTQLTGGAYESRSLIAAAQRCLNLYIEPVPQAEGEPYQATHYCTPGLTLVGNSGQERWRALYTAFDGTLYGVSNQTVYRIDADNTLHALGTFQGTDPSDATARDTPVSMCDNGFVLMIVDGSVDGWYVDLTLKKVDQVLHRIDRGINTGWLGASHVSYQDTFFLFDKPDSGEYYISLSNIDASNLTSAYSVFTATVNAAGAGYLANDELTLVGTGAKITVNQVDNSGAIVGYGVTDGGATNTQPANPVSVTGGFGTGATFDLTYETNQGGFDPLDFATMTGQASKIMAVMSVHRNLWTISNNSFEVWVNTGGEGTIQGSFPFSIYPEAFGSWGCVARYSIATTMNQLYWLSQDKFGHGMVMRGEALSAKRISTHALEVAISSYDRIDDAVSMVYTQQGHVFYLLTFPSAHDSRGATWVYDATTNLWHERAYIDDNGIEYRHVANCISAAHDRVYVGDWRNGNLYTFDLTNYTDNGQPIKRVRSFPHQIDMDSNRRIFYSQLIANMQVGSAQSGATAMAVVSTDFSAPDGTLLEDYSNINSVGAVFSKISGEGEIVNDAVVQSDSGDMLYEVSGTPSSPNYVVAFTMTPTGYDLVPASGSSMFVISRANSDEQGYKSAILSNGTNYKLVLTVMPSTVHQVTLGRLTAGSYRVVTTLKGTNIQVAVQRTEDGLWISPSGIWGGQTPAISIDDSTYTQSGRILMGGTGVESGTGGGGGSGELAPTFEDEFDTLSLYDTSNPSAGGTWQPALWADPDGGIQNACWILNPYNPATPISGVYGASGGMAQLSLIQTPSGLVSACGGQSFVGNTIQTSPSFRQLHGYFEARFASANVPGADPAFFLMSDVSWPPEIDILESVYTGTEWIGKITVWNMDETIAAERYTYDTEWGLTPFDPTVFHSYGVDWQADTLTFFVDRVQVLQCPTPSGYTLPMFPILQLVAGDGTWGTGVTNPSLLPAALTVDYVRVHSSRPF